MSRSGYSEDLASDDPLQYGRWRAQVKSAIRGKRGQAFLRELAAAMDAMPVKELITRELVREDGACCTIGVVCKSRGLDVSKVDCDDPPSVGNLVGIAHQLAAEIEYENDENCSGQTPGKRWEIMRRWVERNIKREAVA